MLERKQEETNFWDRYAGTYDKSLESIFGKEFRRRLAHILENERGLGNVIEFGCGTGYFTTIIAKNAEQITATDLSPHMIETAKANLRGLRNVTFKVENSEAVSLPSETFDTALMANMLHTLDDPLKALKECHRVLKNGGRLFILNYTDEGMGRMERTFLMFRFALKFGFPPKKNWPITGEKLRSLLEEAGFKMGRLELIKDTMNSIFVEAKKG